MTSNDSSTSVIAVVKALLAAPVPLADVRRQVPDVPGIYAIFGRESVWERLGLGLPPDSRPLYVGKSEDSMVRRELKTHFASGRTGQSTVRRSLAGLLRGDLDLSAQPRNTKRPERPANFGLSSESDSRLTEWMKSSLAISCWAGPENADLVSVEIEVLAHLRPPLNLKDVRTEWTSKVLTARSQMTEDCREWIRNNS